MSSIDEKNISFYPAFGRERLNKWDTLPEEDKRKPENRKLRPYLPKLSTAAVSLADVYSYLTSEDTMAGDTEKALPALTRELRDIRRTDRERYKALKGAVLDSVVFAGIPERRREEKTDRKTGKAYKVWTQRNKRNFTGGAVYSGLIVIDIDHLDEQKIDLRRLMERLRGDTEMGLRLIFVSPSGDGLKLVCKSGRDYRTPEEHTREYRALANYVSSTYGVEVDESGADISRMCLLCHCKSEDALLIDSDTTFDSDKHPAPPAPSYVPRQCSRSWDDDDGIETYVGRVEAEGIDIAPGYTQYISLCYSFSSLGERGRGYLHRICRFYPDYDPEQVDYDFDYCSAKPGQSIGTFVNICKAHGIDISLKRREADGGGIPAETTKISDLRAMDGKNEEICTPTAESASEGLKTGKYDKYLQLPTRETLKAAAERKREGLDTPYFLGEGSSRERLKLPAGALTIVSSRTSHGKSKLLQNIALYLAEKAGDGETVLFIHYEESSIDVTFQFASIAVGVPLSDGRGAGNIAQIRKYYISGDYLHIPAEKKDVFGKRIASFDSLLFGGRLRIIYPDVSSDCGDLIGIVEEAKKRDRVKAVFIDYVQLLTGGKGGSDNRPQELKYICKALQDYSVLEGIPIVMAAQLNREPKNPDQMGEGNIADSADISRYANVILSLWNSADTDVRDWSEQSRDKLRRKGFTVGEQGAIYVRASKYRGGQRNIDTVLRFDGATGVIESNDDLPETENRKITLSDWMGQ